MLEKLYMEFAEMYSSINEAENDLSNKKRLMEEIKKSLTSSDSNGSYAVEISAHAYKQISERIEAISKENMKIYQDVMKPGSPGEGLLIPSNLKSFIFTSIAAAQQSKEFTMEKSKKTGGSEFHYNINIKQWSGERNLIFTVIVENGFVKTGYFNWE